jgi:hypothetical protein
MPGLVFFVFLVNALGTWAHISLVRHLYCPIHQQLEHAPDELEFLQFAMTGHMSGWHKGVAIDDAGAACNEHFFPTDKFIVTMPAAVKLFYSFDVSLVIRLDIENFKKEILDFAPKSSPPAVYFS